MPEHKSSGLAIIETFATNLPQLKPPDPKGYKAVGPSSTGTKNAVPPERSLCTSPAHLVKRADAALVDTKVVGDPGSVNVAIAYQLPSDFKNFSNHSEQDVVAAFFLYVYGPIAEVLNRMYPEGWETATEISDSRLNKNLNPRSDVTSEAKGHNHEFGAGIREPKLVQLGKEGKSNEKVKLKKRKLEAEELSESNENGEYKDESQENPSTEDLRYDLVFQTTSVNNIGCKTIAVIEFKKTQQIRYRDFSPALFSAIKNPIGEAPARKNRKKVLRSNAVSYTKQICKYARNSNCRHVALFNWDHLLLYDFYRLQDTKGTWTSGDEVGLIWICEDTSIEGEFIHNNPIRKVMLGWLLQAFAEQLKKD
jgi:hypothetical protein